MTGASKMNFAGLVALFLSRAGLLAAAFATIKISTTLLSPAEVGSVNQLNSFATLFTIALLLPVIAYFTRGVIGWVETRWFKVHAHRMMRAILLAALALSAAGTLAQWGWGIVHAVTATWVGLLLLAYLAGFSTHNLLINCTAVLGLRVRTGLYSNLAAWLGLAAAVVLYLRLGTAESWFLGICIGFLVSGQLFWLFMKETHHSGDAESPGTRTVLPFDTRAVLRFIWPQALVGILWWTQSQSYRFQLAGISDLATVGLFFAGYALCSVPMQAFEAAVNEYFGPMLYGRLDTSTQEGVVRAWNLYASIYVPFILIFGGLIAACAPFLVILALGSEFQSVGSILSWAALGETARALSTVNHAMGIVKVDMRRLLPPAVAGAIAAPTFIQMLAPGDPLSGTALALCIANFVVFAIVFVLVSTTAPVSWPWKRALAATALGIALALAGRIALDTLPHTPVAAFAACAILGALVLAVLYYIFRRSIALATVELR